MPKRAKTAGIVPKDWWTTPQKRSAARKAILIHRHMRESGALDLLKEWFNDVDASLSEMPPVLVPLAGRLKAFKQWPQSCVYFLSLNGKVVYVGQSVNLGSRLSEHVRGKTFDSVFYLPVPRNALNDVEGHFIRALRPPLNGKSGVPLPKWPELVITTHGLEAFRYREPTDLERRIFSNAKKPEVNHE